MANDRLYLLCTICLEKERSDEQSLPRAKRAMFLIAKGYKEACLYYSGEKDFEVDLQDWLDAHYGCRGRPFMSEMKHIVGTSESNLDSWREEFGAAFQSAVQNAVKEEV